MGFPTTIIPYHKFKSSIWTTLKLNFYVSYDMLLADAKDKGLIPDDLPNFTNIDDLIRSLDED